MARVDRTERLLNLVFALMASRQPVTRVEIQATVPGYGSDQTEAAVERMFERDKDELRSMGVPVETVTTVDGEVVGYRIRREDYALTGLSLGPAELAVLALAASVWDDALLSPSAVRAVRKIEAAQGGAASAVAQGIRVQVGAQDAALLPLLQALRETRRVTFPYRAADGSDSTRHCEPWGLLSEQGRWYLAAWDTDRQAPRVFRLSRVTGPVSVLAAGQQHPAPADLDVRALILGEDRESTVVARVHVQAGQGAQLRRMSSTSLDPFTAGEIELPDPGGTRLVAALAAAGDGAQVLGPEALRSDVLAALHRVRERHG